VSALARPIGTMHRRSTRSAW